MLRFVGTNSDGLPLKRKQSQRACERCRKRKKRCDHVMSNDGNSSQHELTTRPPSLVNNGKNERTATASNGRSMSNSNVTVGISEAMPPHHDIQNATPSSITSQLVPISPHDGEEGDNSRFVGDLNPEGIFLAATSPETNAGSIDDSVGIWLPRKALDQVRAKIASIITPNSPGGSAIGGDPLMSKILMPYLEDQCLRTVPTHADFEAIYNVYIDEVHPMFPVIDLQTFEGMQDNSMLKTVLKQSICLAASSNTRSRPYLRLSNTTSATGVMLSPSAYAEMIVYALRTSIDMNLVRDRLVCIQVITLLSMFTQLSDDRHSSAELASRAISYVQTVGLHLDTTTNREDHVYVTRLFCCVWTLDRLNAAFHGRPVSIHDRDIGRDLEASIKSQDGPFQLLLRIIMLLDRVIDLYRPRANEVLVEQEMDFPAFEDLLNKCGALRVPAHILATIETLYHAIAMLANRPQHLKELSRTSPSHLRQSLSATSITSIVGTEFKRQLSPLPFVPYAVSLSLRVYYRELRMSKSPFIRSRARRQLLNACSILRDLGEVFTTSMLMVEMAEETVREMDKIYSTMMNHRRDSVAPLPHDNGASATTEEVSQPYMQPGQRQNEAPPHCVNDSENPIAEFQPQFNQETFDASIFDNMPDLNIFDHFDPDFDLGAIDAALADSIDPSFPTSLIDFNR